ncbi:hypothetical protein [Streptomyces fodineus]|uniref:hypothetical protein n=1 Tax=Streptomyces fodineus TaxID=1904616 RepID=UPI0013EE0365|nr:hypothetical protein [Streptomyces fodineus]
MSQIDTFAARATAAKEIGSSSSSMSRMVSSTRWRLRRLAHLPSFLAVGPQAVGVVVDRGQVGRVWTGEPAA